MANWYVNSAATGTNVGTSWTNACTSCSQLLALGSPPVAGDSIWINSSSAESYGASTTLTFPGTVASPTNIYSVNTTTNQPPVASDLLAGAAISTTTSFSLTVNGDFYAYGVTFSAGSGVNNSTLNFGSSGSPTQHFVNCLLKLPGTAGGGVVSFASNQTGYIILDNTPINTSGVGVGLTAANKFYWRNTPSALPGSAIPITLFKATGFPGTAIIENVDLSALTTGSTIVGSQTGGGDWFLINCKLNGTLPTIATTPAGQNFGRTYLSNTGNAAGIGYQFGLYGYEGTDKFNTAVVRTGGSTTGSQQYSKQIVTTANSKITFPFDSIPMSIWNTSTTSQTLSIFGVWDAPTANTPPNNNDIWAEVYYSSDAGDPFNSIATSGVATVLTTGSAYSTDTSTWSGTSGFTHASPFVITVPFTAAQAGSITVKIKAAKASTTFYIDPLI